MKEKNKVSDNVWYKNWKILTPIALAVVMILGLIVGLSVGLSNSKGKIAPIKAEHSLDGEFSESKTINLAENSYSEFDISGEATLEVETNQNLKSLKFAYENNTWIKASLSINDLYISAGGDTMNFDRISEEIYQITFNENGSILTGGEFAVRNEVATSESDPYINREIEQINHEKVTLTNADGSQVGYSSEFVVNAIFENQEESNNIEGTYGEALIMATLDPSAGIFNDVVEYVSKDYAELGAPSTDGPDDDSFINIIYDYLIWNSDKVVDFDFLVI